MDRERGYDCGMSRATIWDEVRDLLANDKRPTIELAAATRIVMRRAPGRPRANPVSDRFAHWQLKTPSGLPLRCRSFGCNKPLKKSATTICCSQGCSDLLRRYCEDTLAVMNETLAASDYPCYWRSSRTARPRRKREAS